MSVELKHTNVKTNGVTLHVVQAGREDAPLMILLHGFPEFWYGWKQQIDPLVALGYRVWVPDQRGYNLSDKPKGIRAYNLDETSADVIGLIDAAGCEKVIVIGHDWGAAVTWWLANKYPERLEKIVILNVPHHKVFAKTLRASGEQRRKSRYMVFFQIRWLPEILIRLDGWRAFTRQTLLSSRPGTFSNADLEEYRKAWSQPGALTGMINWYRAVRTVRAAQNPRVTIPTLVIWGKRDHVLGCEMAQPSIDLCDNGRLVYIDDASHWVQHEAAERVNSLIGEFLAERP
jgi:pimeloyl-ACP methyl ester carboxylesterase